MGHVRLGQYGKGFLLLAGLLLDFTAIFRLADSDGGRHLLLIVYLMLLLPVFYFISVYDVLQAEEKANLQAAEPLRLRDGILLAASGTFMMILIKPPAFMLPWMNELAEWSVGPTLMVLSVLIVLSLRRGGIWVFKLGRMTAAAVIFVIGSFLAWDLLKGRNDLVLLSEWWPVIFILLGIEMIVYTVWLRKKRDKLRLDGAGTVAALVIAVTAYGVTQYADFPVRWLDQFNVDLSGRMDLGEEAGFRFDKNITKIPFEGVAVTVKIVNPNGDIIVRSGNVDEIELHSTVWVDTADEGEAAEIAEQSIVQVTPGDEIVLEAKGQNFGANGNRLPRMNLEVVVPKLETPPVVNMEPLPSESPINDGNSEIPGSSADVEIESDEGVDAEIPTPTPLLDTVQPIQTLKLEIESGNGSVTVGDVVAQDGVAIRSASGMVIAQSVYGSVNVEGINSSIEAHLVTGDSNLVTQNGTITADELKGGAVYASTLNGDIDLKDIYGDLDAETKNGGILVSGAAGDVKADTLNGSIEVESPMVGGNWDLDSSVGEINLRIPYAGDYSVYGSVTFGQITTDLPLEQTRKSIRGTVGEGIYRIHINATNSISIQGRSQDLTGAFIDKFTNENVQ
nr:DUF4097 family beta strand repeat-containing protein [Paenibacillus soyae]